MEPRIANLIVAFGVSPWPRTLGLARVHVAPNQKLCSITHAVESAKEHFSLENRLDVHHYYLTPVYTEAPYILSDAGLQAEDGRATVIGVAAVGVDLTDNMVNLAASEGPTSTLMVCCLLHLKANLVLVPPQLSCPVWTGMRRARIQYESFIHFTAPYAPPGRLELEVTAHQLGFIRDLVVPEPVVLLSLADQLDNLRAVLPEPREAILESHEEEGTREETPKKSKLAETGDLPRRHHKSCEEKSQSRHSLTKKSPALSSHEHDVVLKADKLGDVVAQACLSVARMSRVVEKAHNSMTAEALLVRQCLEKASAEAINSMKDEFQGARTPADMWWVEKRISAYVSHERAKAYSALTKHHDSVSNDLMGKDRSSGGSSEIMEAEEDFCKSISTLVSTVITEGAKVPGECGTVLTSSILCLVPTLPLDPVLTLIIDLPPEKECRITLGDASRNVPVSQNIVSSLPSSPLTRGASAPMVAGRSTIKFGQAVIWPVTFTQPAMDYPFFKKPASTPISMPQKVWGTPSACSSPLKESHMSPQDTPDLTKSSTEPSVVIEDVVGDDDDDEDEAPAPDRVGSSNIKGIHKSSKQ